jgi:hypothetical protein
LIISFLLSLGGTESTFFAHAEMAAQEEEEAEERASSSSSGANSLTEEEIREPPFIFVKLAAFMERLEITLNREVGYLHFHFPFFFSALSSSSSSSSSTNLLFLSSSF